MQGDNRPPQEGNYGPPPQGNYGPPQQGNYGPPPQGNYGPAPQGYEPPIPPPQGGPGGYRPPGSGYGPPGYGPPGYGGQPVNTTVPIVLGILGLVCCGICAPFAIIQANKGIAEVDRGMGSPSDRSTLNTARILGIIGSVLLVLSVLYVILMFALGFAGAMSGARPGVRSSQPPTFSQPPSLPQ